MTLRIKNHLLLLPLALVLACLAQAAFWTSTASAHRMLIDEEQKGILKVYYQGNIAATMATVTLLDGEGKVLANGPVDVEGKFAYDSKLKPSLAKADDGMGHRATYDFVKGRPQETSVAVKTFFVVAVFLFVAAFFYMRQQQKKKQTA